MNSTTKDITSSSSLLDMGRFCGDPDDRQKAEEIMRLWLNNNLKSGSEVSRTTLWKTSLDIFIDDKDVKIRIGSDG